MRHLLRSLASVAVGAEVATSWGEKDETGWMVELADVDLVYDWDLKFDVEDSHFPELPCYKKHRLTLEFTLVNFHLELYSTWES